MVKYPLRLLLIMVIFTTSCGRESATNKNASYQSVASISGEWLAIKVELNPADFSSNSSSVNLEKQIDNFRFSLNQFFGSPVGYLYYMHDSDEIHSLTEIDSAAEKLLSAVKNNDKAAVSKTALEIDASLFKLQSIDENLSNTSHVHSFQLFFFFTVLVIIIILALKILHSRLERAENRERQSLAFSRETTAAQEHERKRIARDLHDTVAQDLWRLSLKTDIIGRSENPEERSRLCSEVKDGQRELLQRIRNICNDLIPPDFQNRRLGEVLKNLCYEFEQRTGIECQITVQNDLQFDLIDNDTQLQCYRIVQECLANIEKHSGAAEAPVLIRSGEGELLICVSDNGKGFKPSVKKYAKRDSCHALREDGHFGLWNMYECAASINGTLVIDSEPGEGTMVTIKIPVLKKSAS